MPEALVTPQLIRWARERCHLSPEELAVSAKVEPETVRRWESPGGPRPTLMQAAKLASVLRVPLGYLYLESPPPYQLPIPDLRTKSGQPIESPSPDFQDVLNDALRKQEWYREYLLEEGFDSLRYVASFSRADSPLVVAEDIRKTLSLDERDRTRARDHSDYLKLLTDRAEDAGITVLRTGIVGNNTHRTLSVDEFRGFALPDDIAPAIFVNTQDYVAAQVFTIAHELAHIWLGAAGISNVDAANFEPEVLPDIELVCNAIAAELLVPFEDLLSTWDRDDSLENQAQVMARSFKVSSFVILRRMRDLNGIKDSAFWDAWASLQRRTTIKKKRPGGDFWNNFPLRNGRNLSAALIAGAMGGRITFREAASMLNVRAQVVTAAAERYGMI